VEQSRAELPNLSELSHEPVDGPTPLKKAHANGLRKTVARVKSWLKPGQDPETAVKVALLTYLGEWKVTFNEGSRISQLTSTERTIFMIREDTVDKIITEISRA